MVQPTPTPRSGSAVPVGLLIASLVLVALLAWQAFEANRSHHAVL